MKFAKRYATYMRGVGPELPAVGLKRLKKMLNECRRSHDDDGAAAASAGSRSPAADADAAAGRCPGHCSGKN
jgi:E3 ubiquitin-protein ligase BAH